MLKAFELLVNERVNYNNLDMNEQDRCNVGGSGEVDAMSDTTEIANMIVTRS